MDQDEKAAAKESRPSAGSGRGAADADSPDDAARDTPGRAARRGDDADDEPTTPSNAPARSRERRPAKAGRGGAKRGVKPNNVRKLRIERMMSKAELARRANLSVLTIDRVEKGFGCRMDTKRKILEALGLDLDARVQVFGEEE